MPQGALGMQGAISKKGRVRTERGYGALPPVTRSEACLNLPITMQGC